MDITKLKIIFVQIHASGSGYGTVTFSNFSVLPSALRLRSGADFIFKFPHFPISTLFMHIPSRVGEVNPNHTQCRENQVNKLRSPNKHFVRYLRNLGPVKPGGENQHHQRHADHLAYNAHGGGGSGGGAELPFFYRTHDGVHVGRGEEGKSESHEKQHGHDQRLWGILIDKGEKQQTNRVQEHSCGCQDAGFDPVRKFAGIGREDGHHKRLRNQDGTGRLRGQPFDFLQEKAHQEDDGGGGGVVDQRRQIGEGKQLVPGKKSRVKQWMGRSAALDDKKYKQQDPERQQGKSGSRMQMGGVVNNEEKGRAIQQGAGIIKFPCGFRGRDIFQLQKGENNA